MPTNKTAFTFRSVLTNAVLIKICFHSFYRPITTPSEITELMSWTIHRARLGQSVLATGCVLVCRDSFPDKGKRLFLPNSIPTPSAAHPASQSMGAGSYFPGVKWSEREAVNLPLFSAEIKNGGALLLLPHTS
jgi:hypothetical protein